MAKFLKVREVCDRLGVSRAQLYRLVERRLLAAPIVIVPGGRGVAWLETDVIQYIEGRVAETRGAETQPAA